MDPTGDTRRPETEPEGNDLAGKLQDVGKAVTEILPIPSGMHSVTDPNTREAANSLEDDPSLSHALATEDHEVKGLAQMGQEPKGEEVLDLGWNQKKPEIAEPLVGGLDNEELWLLMRRFDKVCEGHSTFGDDIATDAKDSANVSCQVDPQSRPRWP